MARARNSNRGQKDLPGGRPLVAGAPKPIIGIHRLVDELERLKEQASQVREKVDEKKRDLMSLVVKNKATLDRGPKGSIVYKRHGYFVQVTKEEKVNFKLVLPQ